MDSSPTSVAATSTAAFVDAVVEHARRSPEAVALTWRDHTVSYGALVRRAMLERERLAGLPAGEPLALPAVKSPRTLALILACLLDRRPLLLPSPTLGEEVLDALYGQAGVCHVLAAGKPPAATATGDGAHPLPGDTLLLLTTSGSTGTPKIVPLGAAALDRFTAWAGRAFGITTGTAVLNYAPLNFDLCLLEVWTTLARGGRVVLVDPDRATRGRALLELVARERPEVVQAVPMFYRLLTDAAREKDRTLPSVRHAVITGDAMPGALLARLPSVLPEARLYNLYGCTETNDSFLYEVRGAPDAGRPLPLGEPLPGVDALLVTGDGAVLDGPGTGELYVTTPFQSEGYLGPADGSGGFVEHPERADGRRWFRTGDLVSRSADGALTLVGRKDFQVKVRGVRVNPQEAEHRLLAHPDITEAAVVALPDPVAGHTLHAVARRAPGSGLNSLVLRGHLARGLARAAIPSTLLITDDPLPRTSTGKVDRDRAVRQHRTAA
ncbi:amino acid adenylation domain-containing protein [Streptomyces thermospinosisporus]|uniref:Amino acid adenylation domain-containing protein n=1 Tax=Streptomyces thermospinosisporus TaxID=161482 RepID=A0ABN1Z531_9ACTN